MDDILEGSGVALKVGYSAQGVVVECEQTNAVVHSLRRVARYADDFTEKIGDVGVECAPLHGIHLVAWLEVGQLQADVFAAGVDAHVGLHAVGIGKTEQPSDGPVAGLDRQKVFPAAFIVERENGRGAVRVGKFALRTGGAVLHAGDVYRAVVFKLLEIKNKMGKTEEKSSNLNLSNINIKELMKRFKINLRIENKETVVYFGDEKVDINAIQSDEISLAVSKVANIADNKDAYKVVSDIIDNLRKKYNVIFSGRDTMKIYNNLDYHFFIIADLDERVRRKLIQYNNNIDEKTLREHIKKRDNIQKQTGFYDTYDLTIIIDVTDCKDSVESAKKVLKHIKIKETI